MKKYGLLALTMLFAGCSIMPKEKPTTDLKLTYIVSEANATDYCNGGDMDSDGYQKTITKIVQTDISLSTLSPLNHIKTVLQKATTGQCRDVLQQTEITLKDKIVTI